MSSLTEPSEPPRPLDNAPPTELPPVEPPSSGFIIQLFVIPAVIVAVVIAVWLLFGKLAGGERDALDYVERIQSDNENRRWRAAHELASLIGNDARLARDPALLGKLTDLLQQELGKEGSPQLKVYLALALGGFQTLETRSAADPLAALAKALAANQPAVVRLAAAESLAKQAARLDGKLEDRAAVDALAEASADPTQVELRKRATFALGFCGGEPAAEALRKRIQDEDREVRYNAATALAHRGDPTALGVLREMLSTQTLAQVFADVDPKERSNRVETIQLAALQALNDSVRRGRPSLAQLLHSEVVALTSSSLASVRIEADALLKNLPPLRATSSSRIPSILPLLSHRFSV